MNDLAVLRKRLGWTIFASYLIIIVVGVVVLATAAEVVAPASFARHIAVMEALQGAEATMVADLDHNFHAAVREALFVAASAAFLAGVMVSIFVARQIVVPIREMMEGSRRISA